MKIKTEYGHLYIHLTKNTFLDLHTEWIQLDWRRKWNWLSLTAINCYFEKDTMTGGYEFEVALLGFFIRLRVNTKSIKELYGDIDSKFEKLKND